MPVTYKGQQITTQELWDKLSENLGSKEIAYAVLMHNNGYPLDNTSEGAESLQYASLIRLTGNEISADKLKALTYSGPFTTQFGDWLNKQPGIDVDVNGEPIVHNSNGVYFYKGKAGERIPTVPGADYSSISNTLENKSLIPVVSISLGQFMAAYKWAGQDLAASKDTAATYDLIWNKAFSYGIVPHIDKTQDITVTYKPIGTGGQVVLGKKFDRLSDDNKTQVVLRAALTGILLRETQNMTETQRKVFKATLGGFINEYMQHFKDNNLLEQDLNKLLLYLMEDDKFIDTFKTSQAATNNLFDTLYHSIITAIPQHITEDLQFIFNSALYKDRFTDEATPVEEVTPKKTTKELLDAQFTPDTTSSI